MTPLAAIIRDEIADRGPIPVARYMELALAHPEHGYYMTRDPFGAVGDFVTAPEISQMFGELIGLWAAVAWQAMGRPDPVILAELGPGRGTLMADALRAGEAQPGFVAAARPWLVETSAPLRARQARTLAACQPAWCHRVEDIPAGPMIVIANEFFDALPVRQLVRSDGGWAERAVAVDAAGALRFTTGAPVAPDALPPGLPERAAPGEIVELAAAGMEIAGHLGARLAAQGGAALVIDYGHTRSAAGETLQAVRGHDYADPLSDPGTADLTAHVDFEALAGAARAAGAAIAGPLTQGDFLLALGIAQRAEILSKDKDAETRETVQAALRRLIAPSEMGNLFKVVAFADPRLGALPGFVAYS